MGGRGDGLSLQVNRGGALMWVGMFGRRGWRRNGSEDRAFSDVCSSRFSTSTPQDKRTNSDRDCLKSQYYPISGFSEYDFDRYRILILWRLGIFKTVPELCHVSRRSRGVWKSGTNDGRVQGGPHEMCSRRRAQGLGIS